MNLLIQISALDNEQALGSLLQEHYDNEKYYSLCNSGGGVVFSKDGADADNARTDDSACQVANAPKHYSHKGVDDVALANGGVDGTQEGYGAACNASESGTHGEGDVVHLAGVDAHALSHGTVLHHSAHLAAEIRLVHDEPNSAHAKGHQQDNENSVVRESAFSKSDAAAEEGGGGNVYALRTKDGTGSLLQNQANAPCGQKAVDFTTIKSGNHKFF